MKGKVIKIKDLDLDKTDMLSSSGMFGSVVFNYSVHKKYKDSYVIENPGEEFRKNYGENQKLRIDDGIKYLGQEVEYEITYVPGRRHPAPETVADCRGLVAIVKQ